MDRILDKKEQSKGRRKGLINVLLILSIAVIGYFLLKGFLRKRGESKDFHIVKVERGNLKATLSAAGTVVAASERVINAPVSTEIEEVILSTGSEVKAGDLILKLDQEFTRLEYEKLEDELSLRKNNIQKLKLQYDKDLRDIDYQDQIKALELSELEAQVKDQERLLKIGGATQEEVEAAKLKLNIAQIEKKVLENELSFKRAVNTTDKNNLQLEIDIQVKRLKELQKKLNQTQVRSPQDGVITWINEDIGKTVLEGEPLVKIANLNKYKVEATTSDRNSSQLTEGQAVEVRIGKNRLKGIVNRILPEVINNTVRFYVTLEQPDHNALRPSLRTEVYIITNEKKGVLRAKRGTALKGTQSQYVYKVVNNIATKTRITKGLVSSDYFEIESGLNEGDQIIVSETEAFDHMNSFEIKD